MKIINEKGKLFGIINLVDLICILLVLLLVGGIGWKLLGTKVEQAVSPTSTVTCIFRVRGAQSYLQDWLNENDQIGQQLVAGSGYVDGAYVEDMWMEPYVTQATTDDGRIVDATDPTKKDILFKVTGKVAANSPILKIGTQEVRTGTTFIIKTRTFEISSTIQSVTVE